MEQHSTEYKLSNDDATTIRALSARANYLSQDRADICFSTKELCREFEIPSRHSREMLERGCRYPVGKTRLVNKYDWGSGAADDDDRTLPAPTAEGPGAKRQGAKAVKKKEQHSTEYKLSSEDATNLFVHCQREQMT